MTDEDIDRAIKDARGANTKIPIRDSNGKVFQSKFENPIGGEEEEEISMKPQIWNYSVILVQALKKNKKRNIIFYIDRNE